MQPPVCMTCTGYPGRAAPDKAAPPHRPAFRRAYHETRKEVYTMTTTNDSLDFYPTPDSLAFDMVFSLREVKSGFTTYPKPILEPSAGDGALARQVHALAFNVHHDYKTGEVDQYDKGKARSAELDCIELSSDFRAVLKKDGFRVVHDNFLTFRPTTKYAAVIMNPPFSEGARHLLKALDIMQDGGKVRCLLNAETLRNPCTNERKELAAKLEELHATVKYIPDAFKNARRTARVEVALVSVDIPDREPVSRIRLDLKNETAERLKENPEFAALVSSDPITAAIERYNAAAEGVRRIYEEYNGIKSLFSSAGAGKKENPVMAFTKSYNDAIRELRGMYWKQLFEMPQLFDAMTYEMQQDYQKRIKELEGYDFSAYNILTVREEISRNLLSSIDHEIIKLFDDWTNLHYNDEYSKNVHYYNGWCTNSAYKINRKVIFRCNAFDTYDGRFCPRYNATGHVAQIERVLHFLDTNGKPYNGDELRAVLDAAEKSGQTQKIQLHYFTATFYKKGTCHIEFTNTDVLKSFNLYAGQRKGWLPPTYGKKSYHDMAAADRRVVDSYEGEASYTDTLTRHLIPTQSTFLQLNA
nr:MAG TPA: Type I restriction enzyme Methylase [Caudoviricetes sp.]